MGGQRAEMAARLSPFRNGGGKAHRVPSRQTLRDYSKAYRRVEQL
jgi:hypothetical protein